jgi:MoaA/NifB/PqqE/SkfB family radical SAM enzyme
MKTAGIFAAWGRILGGATPMLSIEITRECPLHCPGCYAYGDEHLGGEVTLRQLHDYRGDDLVHGVLGLVRKHRPVHVSLVGGEPMIRHRELARILPVLADMGIYTLVVTSGVIPVPAEWCKLPGLEVAVSVDGLPEHHDERRKPATYERILKNIRDCIVNVHWTITAPMFAREGYLEEYLGFWNARPEVRCIWFSLYSPQLGEHSVEMLTRAQRLTVAERLPLWRRQFPKLIVKREMADVLATPPRSPEECLFSKVSINYSADLETTVEPCIFGGNPDCSQCGCGVTLGLEAIGKHRFKGGLRVGSLVGGSVRVGRIANRLRSLAPSRMHGRSAAKPAKELVQIGDSPERERKSA